MRGGLLLKQETISHYNGKVRILRHFRHGGSLMEQLNITTTKDNDKVYKILGDLMNGDKEFQIMITVPSSKKDKKQDRLI